MTDPIPRDAGDYSVEDVGDLPVELNGAIIHQKIVSNADGRAVLFTTELASAQHVADLLNRYGVGLEGVTKPGGSP